LVLREGEFWSLAANKNKAAVRSTVVGSYLQKQPDQAFVLLVEVYILKNQFRAAAEVERGE
jgi:hypothetical protein